ncbi:MAG TPA: hypothetical protein VED41_00285, partial [Solirubrobacteraceae bacterium]|nr:hypothetical protein [Solirubrobacteraceae bacterium]
TTDELGTVQCTSETFCLSAFASSANTFNGSSWSPRTLLGGLDLEGVSCTSSSFCVTLDSYGRVSTYDGSEWSTPLQTRIGDETNFSGVIRCASPSFCAIVGHEHDAQTDDALTFNGSEWSAPVPIPVPGPEFTVLDVPESMSCPSSSFCMAVAEEYAMTFNGSSWSHLVNVPEARFNSVSCPSASFCMAVGRKGRAATYNGSYWTAVREIDSRKHDITSVSCVSSTFCVAVDNHGDALTYNGTKWKKKKINPELEEFSSVSCVSSTFCVAVEQQGWTATFNGKTWSEPVRADPNTRLYWVSCTSETFCAAADQYGDAVIAE